jgi:hypothetical protein
MRMNHVLSFLMILSLTMTLAAQTETLTNTKVIEMAKAGLGDEVVLSKIKNTECKFDVSADGLIELKKGGVSDAVIALMMEKSDQKNSPVAVTAKPAEQGYTENQSNSEAMLFSKSVVTPKEALQRARTIALVKVSLQPSRQALEKELMKRSEWKQFNLSIERYKQDADLYVEIGFVPLSLITHRYVYRIYDRRSGIIIAAGETTSWGSLAENLAKHIVKSLNQIEKN